MTSSIVVLITGANSGVGYAIAKIISSASPDYDVIIAGRRLEACNKAVSELKAEGAKGGLSTLQLDQTDEASVDAAAKQVEKEFGKIDVLINNAGITDTTLPDEWSPKKKFDQVLSTNVTGPAIVSQAFQPLLFKSKNAYSIYVSTSLASMAMSTDPKYPVYHVKWAVYRASKTGLNAWVVQDAREMAEKGVKVFAFCPGLVRSNLRGTTEDQVSSGGYAGDPDESGRAVLKIIQGDRDGDVGKFVHKDGVYDW
ncbi:MAG: hypothetical protein M1820_007616 [Bogoriella megaspora]|nr:MAG: hypothetical protein M1820_007616 [Bogoriella megaspora]